MPENYFARLISETPTRMWVNNPTASEIRQAIANGAVGCTTNPAFAGGLVKRAPQEVQGDIAAAVATESNDDRAAELIQQRLVARILPPFEELFKSSGGRLGFVSIQGPPAEDSDPAAILAAAHTARSIGANCIPKIPATKPGLEAFEVLVAEGHPTLVTEVFSLAQVIEACERYERVSLSTGVRPEFIMAPITGIFGDHLRKIASRDGLDVDQADIEWAGVAFSRAAVRLVADRRYPVTLLFGGARTTLDLVGLVGSQHQATINWSTFAEVIALDPPIVSTVSEPVPVVVLEHLSTTFDDFRRALLLDGLSLDEFEAFGPVQQFRDNFVEGWNRLLVAIRDQRAARAVPLATGTAAN